MKCCLNIKPSAFIVILILHFLFYPSSIFAISLDDEKELSKDAARYGQYCDFDLDNGFASQYFKALGQYLSIPVETKHFTFHFYIINDSDVNAFATVAGYVFFYSGLINIVDNVDELAAVLCHEISHVSARHISKGMERQKKINYATLAGLLAGALIGGEAAGPLILGSMAAGVQARINFTREDERQADQMGFKYMSVSGFNAKAMATLFQKFETLKRMSPYRNMMPPPYLQTHPTDQERISNVDSMLKQFVPQPPGEEVTRFRTSFPFFQAVVRAKSLDVRKAEKLFLGELKKNPDSISSHFGLGLVYIRCQDYEQAYLHLDKALKAKPGFAPMLACLGKAHQMNGDDEKAIFYLKKAMELDEENDLIPYHIGLSYENMEQYNESIRYFKRLTFLKPVVGGVYYHLGVSYGRQDKLVLAHYNFGLCHKRWGNVKKAKFHFRKAFKLAKDDPEMREKIQKEQDEIPRDFPYHP